MSNILDIPNERLNALIAELPVGAYVWLEYVRDADWTLEEKLTVTAMVGMYLGQRMVE